LPEPLHELIEGVDLLLLGPGRPVSETTRSGADLPRARRRGVTALVTLLDETFPGFRRSTRLARRCPLGQPNSYGSGEFHRALMTKIIPGR
jgi:hypothetical protein